MAALLEEKGREHKLALFLASSCSEAFGIGFCLNIVPSSIAWTRKLLAGGTAWNQAHPSSIPAPREVDGLVINPFQIEILSP